MRVTHVISNLNIGGAEGSLCTLIESLPRQAAAHTVISMLPNGAYKDRLRDAGAHVVDLAGARGLSTVALLPEIGRAVAKSQPDILQAWMYHANLAASLSGIMRYHRVPTLWNVRQTIDRLRSDKTLTQAVILTASLLRRHPRRVIYNSMNSALQHERVGYPAGKRMIIYNAIDTERFRPRDEARARLVALLAIPPDSLIVGRVARNAPMKDNPTLFAAFAEVRRHVPDARLVVVGAGMSRDDREIDSLVTAHGLSGHVHFTGVRLDIEHVYPAFDVLVSSSSHAEGFPNVIAEAMASGVPPVSTDVGEARLIVGDDGIIVPPRAPSALADGIVSLLKKSENERRSMGAKGRGAITDRFSAPVATGRYLEAWQDAIAAAATGHPRPTRPDPN